jgi:cell division FtsZ-interacting protein ZapD
LVRYEYPLNEGIRTMLRLEHLFDRLGQLIPRDNALDHHFALATLFEIMDVAGRADLKSDLLKDLERHKLEYQAFRNKPGVSEAALDAVLAKIEHAFNTLNALPGKAGAPLATNEFLMTIRSRISIPGGTCEFDLPAYYAWQQLDAARRRADLMQWIATVTNPSAPSRRTLNRWNGLPGGSVCWYCPPLATTRCGSPPSRPWPKRRACCSACCATPANRSAWSPRAGSTSRRCRRASRSTC